MEREDIVFYREIEQKFVAFAEGREDIRAAFIIGSRARTDHPADRWSDMDIVFYTTNPEFYLQQQDWLENMGAVLCSFAFRTSGGDPERLTLFRGGWQVDFVVSSADVFHKIVEIKKIPDNFYRGVKIIVDKDNQSKEIMPDYFQPPQNTPISETAYLNVTNMFWFSALYIAKQLLRGELWVAKMRDYDLKSFLLQMVEWHEKVVFDKSDTWHAGRFMSEWVSEDTQNALIGCFGRYNKEDSWSALLSTMSLFGKLSRAVASKMQYDIPKTLESNVYDWIKNNTGKL